MIQNRVLFLIIGVLSGIIVACSPNKSDKNTKASTQSSFAGYWIDQADLIRLQSQLNEDGSCGPVTLYNENERGEFYIDAYKIDANGRVQILLDENFDGPLNSVAGTMIYPGVFEKNNDGIGVLINYGMLRSDGNLKFMPEYQLAIDKSGPSFGTQVSFHLLTPDELTIKTRFTSVPAGFSESDWLGDESEFVYVRTSLQSFKDYYQLAALCAQNQVLKRDSTN